MAFVTCPICDEFSEFHDPWKLANHIRCCAKKKWHRDVDDEPRMDLGQADDSTIVSIVRAGVVEMIWSIRPGPCLEGCRGRLTLEVEDCFNAVDPARPFRVKTIRLVPCDHDRRGQFEP